MNILVVDDEYYIVKGMKGVLEQNASGICHEPVQVEAAYSARQAQQTAGEHPVDILITDIEMPRESGLELIRALQVRYPRMIPILVTGHENFDYAREAIRLKCFRYLVKPVKEEELVETVRDAAAQILRQKEGDYALQTVFFSRVLSQAIPPEEGAIQREADKFGISGENLESSWYPVLFYPQTLKSSGSIASSANALPFHAAELEDLLHALFPAWTVHAAAPSRGQFGLLFRSDREDLEQFTGNLRSAAGILKRNFQEFRITFYVSDKVPLSETGYAYEMLRVFADALVPVHETEVILIPPRSRASDSVRSRIPGSAGQKDLDHYAKWEHDLKTGRIDRILQDFRSLLYDGSEPLTLRQYEKYCSCLLSLVFTAEGGRRNPSELPPVRAMEVSFPPGREATPEKFMEWAEKLLESADAGDPGEPVHEGISDAVLKYIDAHLSDPNLKRSAIAGAVHVAPDYLSFVFHKETGEVLTNCITRKRIEKAEYLLVSTDLPLQIICDKCGFNDPSYFHRQFRKYAGMTPMECRNRRSGKTDRS